MTRPISLIPVVSNKRLVYWFTLERPFFVEMRAKNRALCVCEWRRYLPCLSRQRCQMYAYRESETKHKSGFYSGWLSFFRPGEIHRTHFFMSKQYFFNFEKNMYVIQNVSMRCWRLIIAKRLYVMYEFESQPILIALWNYFSINSRNKLYKFIKHLFNMIK